MKAATSENHLGRGYEMNGDKEHGLESMEAVGIDMIVLSEEEEQTREARSRLVLWDQGIIKLGYYAFEGPYWRTDKIRGEPGILAVLDDQGDEPLDFIETDDIRSELDTGWRMKGWRGIVSKDLMFAVLYMRFSEAERQLEIVEELKREFRMDRTDKSFRFER